MMFKISHQNGHYVVYKDNEFYCTADTYEEAQSEIDKFVAEFILK